MGKGWEEKADGETCMLFYFTGIPKIIILPKGNSAQGKTPIALALSAQAYKGFQSFWGFIKDSVCQKRGIFMLCIWGLNAKLAIDARHLLSLVCISLPSLKPDSLSFFLFVPPN
jgi:hypothetical protein